MLSLWDLIGSDEDWWMQPTNFSPPRSTSVVSMETPRVSFQDHYQPPTIPKTSPPDYASFWSLCPEAEENEAEPDSCISESWTRIVRISDKPFEKKSEREKRIPKPDTLVEKTMKKKNEPPTEVKKSNSASVTEKPLKRKPSEPEKKEKIPVDEKKKLKFEAETVERNTVFKKPAPPPPSPRRSVEPPAPKKPTTRREQINNNKINFLKTFKIPKISEAFHYETDILILHPEPEEYREFNKMYRNETKPRNRRST